ncbi:hypothetical protein B0T17DRAFT_510684 [Bombardia bombarda]|uniref:Uncharacterized protein n=1 Tax=Bombardia bombarda TaxID=252184 RepID=A0AA40BV51_9PEZI|nr:hypothetical protein B0T17DRAFT_510684 [Bombardia bombarda]
MDLKSRHGGRAAEIDTYRFSYDPTIRRYCGGLAVHTSRHSAERQLRPGASLNGGGGMMELQLLLLGTVGVREKAGTYEVMNRRRPPRLAVVINPRRSWSIGTVRGPRGLIGWPPICRQGMTHAQGATGWSGPEPGSIHSRQSSPFPCKLPTRIIADVVMATHRMFGAGRLSNLDGSILHL